MEPCVVCGVFTDEEHDHRAFGTLSPESALADWEANNAPKSWE